MIPNSADYWRFITDWRAVDFDRYNPADNSHEMQYPEYWSKRTAGILPAPSRATVIANLANDPRLGK